MLGTLNQRASVLARTLTPDGGGGYSESWDVIATVWAALVPGGAIAGVAIPTVVAIAKGVVTGIPEAVAAYDDIKAAIDGAAPPTPAQLAALKSAADAADGRLQADIKAASGGG